MDRIYYELEKKNCPPNAVGKAGCLHGGVCFALGGLPGEATDSVPDVCLCLFGSNASVGSGSGEKGLSHGLCGSVILPSV